jgi:hypothetical protein
MCVLIWPAGTAASGSSSSEGGGTPQAGCRCYTGTGGGCIQCGDQGWPCCGSAGPEVEGHGCKGRSNMRSKQYHQAVSSVHAEVQSKGMCVASMTGATCFSLLWLTSMSVHLCRLTSCKLPLRHVTSSLLAAKAPSSARQLICPRHSRLSRRLRPSGGVQWRRLRGGQEVGRALHWWCVSLNWFADALIAEPCSAASAVTNAFHAWYPALRS